VHRGELGITGLGASSSDEEFLDGIEIPRIGEGADP
jgi:hypothetical protein